MRYSATLAEITPIQEATRIMTNRGMASLHGFGQG